MEHYQILGPLGQGQYGTVERAQHRQTGQLVAIKRVAFGAPRDGVPFTVVREIALLKKLNHPHIVRLYEAIGDAAGIHLVLELLDMPLDAYLRQHRPLPLATVRTLMRQLLSGIAHCHARNILHRDLKPANLLLNVPAGASAGGPEPELVLKVADFGLGRRTVAGDTNMMSEVVTSLYRAPELVLGSTEYDGCVDVWAVGCIFAELADERGAALFTGGRSEELMANFVRRLGPPTEANWPHGPLLPQWAMLVHGRRYTPVATDWAAVSPRLSQNPAALDVLAQMLRYDPTERISAAAALAHPYFAPSP
eukprot:TRINITY_DN6912_c0_g1_i3.p1 TRINITY_DN6912_c0_g1~~TRINITY_DN6912_c0_g1_i3.p1  ORF type:complete len:317 (-),score=59.07 TRINITY_DN6912_c0_g1_i3:22-945(-)